MEDFEFDKGEFITDLDLQIKTALDNADLFGASDEEKKQIKSGVIKSYVINFLEQIKEYLDNLTNRSLAAILLMLIDLGVEFENEEEILFWINKIERQALNRIEIYTLPGASRFIDDKKRNGLLAILFALKKKDPKKNDMFRQIEIALKDEQTNFSNDNQNHNSLAILQQKLSSAGVEVDGRYWKHVINEYNMSINKNEFVNKWTPNVNDVEKFNSLCSLEFDAKLNFMQNEKPKIIEQDNAIKQSEENRLNKESNKIKEENLIKQKNKKLIEKEFSDKKNRKAARKIADKKDRQLDIRDIQKIKLKVSKSKRI